jgi:formylglycine-generating enzyme required for sulfatase activity
VVTAPALDPTTVSCRIPYVEYSASWFDGNHYTLRGGSLYTRPAVKRASFRNFYQPGMRHILACLCPVY